MANIFLCLFAIFPVSLLLECDVGGTWSTWQLGPNQTGYDYCGACWQANWIRQCLSLPDCPCSGTAAYSSELNIEVCLYPRYSCCAPFKHKIKILRSYGCGNLTVPPADTPIPNATYCPPSGVGVWSSWGDWSVCSASCGSCGMTMRSRNCTSEAYGCPCSKSDIGNCQAIVCGGEPCPTGPSCCNNYPLTPAMDGSNQFVCNPYIQ